MPRAFFALLLLALLVACSRPPATIASGTDVRHVEAHFQVIAPAGWKVHQSRDGVMLTRQLPYGGGYPSFNVRRIDEVEVEALELEGASFNSGGREVTYRYVAWNSARGRGWRLEALLVSSSGGALFADASVWDESPSLDKNMFETEFWPILNSIQDDR